MGVGVAVIGTGYMGKCHALSWTSVTSVYGDVERPRLVAICDADAARAGACASEWGFAQATADWRAAIDDTAVDVVSITTPNRFHAEMAIFALERGKHVWCEKPMATTLADAEAMTLAAAKSGRVAALGYNYVQNPAIRHVKRLIESGAIGAVAHARVEMDEDFMADADEPFSWRAEKSAGYGALDDFGVHAFSLLRTLVGETARVCCDMMKPYADRAAADGSRRAIETYDVATVLLRFANGASGSIALSRAAWGRKNRIFVQIFGAKGSITFDQERLNELQLYVADGDPASRGFRTILIGAEHEPYGLFCPAPGHQLGFNDLKIIECRELLRRIAGGAAHLFDFNEGLKIERAVHASARSHESGGWIDVA
ncbi:Gfo/Idh/MocA family oxidoreductase [Terrarubrum flagellatum]|uniref:Gfo/Idh/MocA family protein n=1 Tax=Terrirubrum flagellatum TaxID=2895980 RepID=UPI00314524FE